MPFSSCSRGVTAWQRTDGRARWQVGELWVPGMERAERGVESFSSSIHEARLADEKSVRCEYWGR